MIKKNLRLVGLVSGVLLQMLLLPSLALAQQTSDEEAMVILAVVGVVLVIALMVGLAIAAFICWLVSGALKELPEQFQLIPPGHVWLLMIPCFSIIWNFFVYPKVSESYENYFRSTGQHVQFGDCSKEIGRWYCICGALSAIPYIGGLFGIASLVLLIIFLVKLSEYKRAVMTQPGKLSMG